MKLSPFISYFGGKYRSAPRYPVPQHRKIIEPFAGSAGYSVRYPSLNIHLNDIDPAIFSTWKYLVHVKESEIMALPTKFADVRDLSISQEAKWLIGYWVNKGMTSPCNIPTRWMTHPDKGRLNTYWGEGVKHRIASQLQYIRDWTITNLHYESLDNIDACWFVDPPYQFYGHRYRHHTIDYPNLAAWCQSRVGQVIVCEQEGADWLPFESMGKIKSSRGFSKEVVWSRDR